MPQEKNKLNAQSPIMPSFEGKGRNIKKTFRQNLPPIF